MALLWETMPLLLVALNEDSIKNIVLELNK